MKKNRIFPFLVLIAMVIISCDKVKNPIVKKNPVIGSKYVIKNNKDVSNIKKVLLEDYTGQRCPNCPTAASIISNTLVPQYGNRLVVIAVHQGNTFAKPNNKYPNDFRTTAGEVWGSTAGFNVDFWPNGLINRKNYSSSSTDVKTNYTSWTSVIPTALNDPFIVKLDVTTEYDTTARALNTYVNAKFNMAYPNTVKVSVLLMEDGIVGKQDVNGVENEEYEFEHMMRGDINGTWGTDLKTGPILANDSAKVSFPNFSLPVNINNGLGKTVNDKKVSVVVFAYDAVTRVVLQAEKVKIRNNATGQ